MPTPPIIPAVPSTTRTLRWVRLFRRRIAYGRSGRKRATLTPDAFIRSMSSVFMRREPTQSSRTLTGTPSAALAASVSATSTAISPCQ
jgi:hypothetical protein